MSDPLEAFSPGLTSPPLDGFAIVPNDGADLARYAKGIFCGSGGNVACVTVKGTSLTFVVPTGGLIPFCIRKVLSTGTTAGSMIGGKD